MSQWSGAGGLGRAAALVCVGLAAAAPAHSAPSASPPPSILLILVDTLRADYLGTYGFRGAISPNLDHFAHGAVVFERCYSHAPWTKPAVASLLTGLHPTQHRVLRQGSYGAREGEQRGPLMVNVLGEDQTTLAEILKERGYATAAFVANPWIVPNHGWKQGFDVFDRSQFGNEMPATPLLEAAETWLAQLPEDRGAFLLLHLMDVHGPYTSPDADFEHISQSPGLGDDVTLSKKQFRRIYAHLRNPAWTEEPSARQVRTWRGRYAAGVFALDRRVGPFLDRILSSKRFADGVVVLTSDHGEALFDHEGWGHGRSLYEHQLRVPLFIRFPNGEHGGTRVTSLVGLIDVVPTLAGFAGAELPAGLAGTDLRPLATSPNRETKPGRASYATGVATAPDAHAISVGRYKLIADAATDEITLFDVVGDPVESRDLAPTLPDVASELRERLYRHLALQSDLPPEQAALPDEVQEHLRALGYLVDVEATQGTDGGEAANTAPPKPPQ